MLHFACVLVGSKPRDIVSCSMGGRGGFHVHLPHGHSLPPSCHAEVNALKTLPPMKFRERRRKCKGRQYRKHPTVSRMTLVVVRFSMADGALKLAESRPCYHCLKTMQLAGIERVCFSTVAPDHTIRLQTGRVSELIMSGNFAVSSGNREHHTH